MELHPIMNNLIFILFIFIKYKLLSYLIDELSNNLGLGNSFFIVLFVIIYLNYFEFKLLNRD